MHHGKIMFCSVSFLCFLVFSLVSLYPLKSTAISISKESKYSQNLYSRGYLYSKKPKFIPAHYKKVYKNLWVDRRNSFTKSEKQKVFIIGFVVDIRDSKMGSLSIANKLEDALHKSENAFHDQCDYLCGRYVILYTNPSGTLSAVSDASSLKKIFFSKEGNVIASHAKLLSDNLFGYKNTAHLLKPWPWPVVFNGLETPYSGVSLLPPNHKIELETCNIDRIFPRVIYAPLDVDKAEASFKRYVRNSILAAYSQSSLPLLFCFTHGLDSRASIALAYDNKIPFRAFTYECSKSDTKIDLEYAKEFCKNWSIPHYQALAKCNYQVPMLLRDVLAQNNYQKFGHFNYTLTESVINTLGEDNFLIINSNILEIGRSWHNFEKYKAGVNNHPANTKYAKLTSLNSIDYMGYDVRQLYFWEQQLGAFLLFHLMEYDISCDVFNPYNSRAIIDIMLRTRVNWGEIQQRVIDDWLRKLEQKLDQGCYNCP